jgi:hypothetical protein
MPFKSEKQRRWMYKNKPEMAEEFQKATPKGKKLPKYAPKKKTKKKKKKKSAIERIRLILAEEIQQGLSSAPSPGEAVPEQAPPQQQMDVGTLTSMVPKIMGQLDSSDVNQTKNYFINEMNVDAQTAEQAVTNYAVKIYKEENAKRQRKIQEFNNKTVMDVAQKFGIDPEKVKGWADNKPLPPLSQPGAAMLDRAIRLGNIVRKDAMKRYASVDNALDTAKNASTSEKIKNLISFFSSFDSIEDGVSKILSSLESIKSTIPADDTVTASVSGKIGVVASVLWAVTFILALGATGESDFNARYWHLNPDKADEFTAMAAAFSSMGLASITQALSNFFKKKEDKVRNRAYQGNQLG